MRKIINILFWTLLFGYAAFGQGSGSPLVAQAAWTWSTQNIVFAVPQTVGTTSACAYMALPRLPLSYGGYLTTSTCVIPLRLTNTGTTILTVSYDKPVLNGDFGYIGPPSPRALGPTASMEFAIFFTPSMTGTRINTFTITVNGTVTQITETGIGL